MGYKKAAFSLSLEYREGLCLVEEGARGRGVWRRDVALGKGEACRVWPPLPPFQQINQTVLWLPG